MSGKDYELMFASNIDAPSVSVIVPVYNMENNGFLFACLKSLVGQDLESLEIICIDDVSTDKSLEVLCDFARRYPNITVAKMQKNSGQGTARNRGIDLAQGDYIGFVDADDYVDFNYYSSLYKEACRSGAMVVEAPVKLVNAKGEALDSSRLYYPMEYVGIGELSDRQRERLILEHPYGVQCIFIAWLMKLETSRFAENMAYEDTPAGIRRIEHIRSISQVHDTTYYYRQNPASTAHTTTISSRKMQDRLKSSEMILDDARRLGYYDRYNRSLDQYFLDVFFFNTIMQAFGDKDPTTEKELSFVRRLSLRARSRVPKWRRAIVFRKISLWSRVNRLLLLGAPDFYFMIKKWVKRGQRRKSVRC